MSTKTIGTLLFALTCTMMSVAVLATEAYLFTDSDREFVYDPSQPWVIRGRHVEVDLETFDRATVDGLFGLNLFTDRQFEGRVTQIARLGAQRSVVRGDLVGLSGSSFTLARNQGVLVGSINAGDHGNFQLRHTSLGHEVVEVDHGAFPPCGTDHDHEIAVPLDDAGGEAHPTATGDAGADPATMDVMVVYTPNARDAVGGTPAMQALIDLGVAETNTAYANSGIASRIRLAHRYEVNYNSSGDFNTDLERLTGRHDGYMDDVHGVRNQYGADLVSLWIDNTQYCGIAWLMTNLSTYFESLAFSVVHYGCATGYYSFGHEMGHNQGSAHDRANADSAVFPYSYGWRFRGQDGKQYRTVMAYDPGTRVDHFSSPLVSYQGTPTGTATDDNARSIDETASTVAAFRDGSGGTCPAETIVAKSPDRERWLDLLYAVRDRVLPTVAGGEDLIHAYYDLAPEVGWRLLNDRGLWSKAMALLMQLRPSLERAVATGDLSLTAGQQRAVTVFARALQVGASESLEAELERFLQRLRMMAQGK